MDNLTKNMAGNVDELNQQKEKMQREAQMGEEASEIAAKLPVSPETVIEGVMMWRKTMDMVTANLVPILGALAVMIAFLAYEVLAKKSKAD